MPGAGSCLQRPHGSLPSLVTVLCSCAHRVTARAGESGDGGGEQQPRSVVSPLWRSEHPSRRAPGGPAASVPPQLRLPPCFAGTKRLWGSRHRSPGCGECLEAPQELQRLVLPALRGREAAALRPDLWQVAWKDREQLVERGSLSCWGYGFPRSTSCPAIWTNASLEHHGGAPAEPAAPCHPAPRQEAHPTDSPAKDQPLASALSGTSSAEEADGLPGKRQCLQSLTAPAAPWLWKQGSGAQEPPAEVCSSIQPPEMGVIVRESLLHPDEVRQHRVELSQRPPGFSEDLPAPPSPTNTVLQKDQGCQTDFVIILRPLGAEDGHGTQPHTAAPVDISELPLRPEQCSKACMDTASEEKLESSSGTVPQSPEGEHEALPQRASSGSLPPQLPSVPFLRPKPLLHPDQVKRKRKKHGASVVCPAASGAPRPEPAHFHGPEATFMGKELQHRGDQLGPERPSQRAVPRQEGGWAAPRAHTHCTKNSGQRMDTAPLGEIVRTPFGLPYGWAGQEPTIVYPPLRPVLLPPSPRAEHRREHRRKHRRHLAGPAAGAPHGHWGSSTAQPGCSDSSFHLRAAAVPQKGNTSAEVTTASETTGAEAGSWGPKWWPWRKKSPGKVESSPGYGAQSSDSLDQWTTGSNLPRGNARARPAPGSASTRAQEPHGNSSSSSEPCSAPITRYQCSCHLRHTCGTQGTAAQPSGNSIRSFWDRICHRQQKASASPQSSASEHCCHAGHGRGRASAHGACDSHKLHGWK